MHNWARYLIFFQYIGTKYRGVVKVPPQQLGQSGVQEHLEEAIKRLKPVNPVSLSVSSRTDAGVHALSNSAHFDLQRKNDKPPFTADVLVEALNFNLKEQQIRELDIDAMHEAAALLVGTHDFSSFRAVNSDLPFKNPVKTVDVVTIQPGSSFAHSHFHRRLQFWELTFKSQSFLYKQVRRMTGVLVAAGQGRLSVSQVKQILDARDTLAFPHDVAAPAYGLFLKSVDYKESDLLFSQKPDATEDPKT
ncbi:PREDICTED: tRNA pseudouridine synthase-like 1 isoform X3 [Poecilia mexicana]|uniref:tRNA pseudouridine synthase-like 1 isoform X3 n=1 Tax=Poecilia formosa TaxID=48698 RepID=UPI0004445E40|nr:PREDICTED: tRNA pseudouridine synthase-like 1 isoform X3 [Poecilia formosa]XP_014826808.1 PREDICTED: tRNA pseudouridine synthase-like 1 isoform X3 [Poecilia mexicana]